MSKYLKLRTFIVLTIVILFACSIYPLTPPDFYRTFLSGVVDGKEDAAQQLVNSAQAKQTARPDLYPAAALLEAANEQNMSLKELTNAKKARDNSEVISNLRERSSSSIRLGLDLNGGVEFVLRLNPDYSALKTDGLTAVQAEEKLKENFNQYRDLAMEALRKRLEAKNIFETEIAPFANYGLSLKAPIVSKDEKDQLKKLIQMSNKLEFRLVHQDSDEIIQRRLRLPVGYEILREAAADGAPNGGPAYVVAKHPEMTGTGVDEAFVSKDQFGSISIALRFNRSGTERFAKVTNDNLMRQLAIVMDGTLYCAPQIKTAIIDGQAEISGHFTVEEAQNVADALTSGSFPFKIDVEAVYDTAPSLGADNVKNGIWAGLAAMVLLAGFMITYYRTAGVIAVIALTVNVVLILGAMAAFGATMTMPGIAGIILTLGMAVDANVLVFERMREEKEAGKPPQDVVEMGFKRAYSSVLDGNLTTLLVSLILMYFGTGAIKGFAVSLSIGIVSSLFTALFMSHLIFDWLLYRNPNMQFKMMSFFSKPSIRFIKQSKLAILVSLAMIVISIGVCLFAGRNMLSVDFTGGTLLSYNYSQTVPVAELERTLSDQGYAGKITYKSNASGADNRKLEILLRDSKTDQMNGESATYADEQLMNSLNQAYPQLQLTNGQSTIIGGLVGAEMTKNAVISILLAFVGMIIYVAFRYEFHYAVAGILALVHDTVIALGIFVLAGRELSLPVVAGLLTIIGYSINDTIVIFDRIRETLKFEPNRPFSEVVDESLNRTLSRTVLTSLTTFIVVVVMFFCGGLAINDFMFIIGIGIIVGSYSSLYIASPIVAAWHKVTTKRKKAVPAVK